MSSTDSSEYNPAIEFQDELKQQRCGFSCCNTFCAANLCLLLCFIWNIVYLLGISIVVFAAYSPYNTLTWPCYSDMNGGTEYCDLREIIEENWNGDQQKARLISVSWLIIQVILTICNALGFIGLWNCIPWMILLNIFIATLGTVCALIGCVITTQYDFIILLVIPAVLICFFVQIWNTAKKHKVQAINYQNADLNKVVQVV